MPLLDIGITNDWWRGLSYARKLHKPATALPCRAIQAAIVTLRSCESCSDCLLISKEIRPSPDSSSQNCWRPGPWDFKNQKKWNNKIKKKKEVVVWKKKCFMVKKTIYKNCYQIFVLCSWGNESKTKFVFCVLQDAVGPGPNTWPTAHFLSKIPLGMLAVERCSLPSWSQEEKLPCISCWDSPQQWSPSGHSPFRTLDTWISLGYSIMFWKQTRLLRVTVILCIADG